MLQSLPFVVLCKIKGEVSLIKSRASVRQNRTGVSSACLGRLTQFCLVKRVHMIALIFDLPPQHGTKFVQPIGICKPQKDTRQFLLVARGLQRQHPFLNEFAA